MGWRCICSVSQEVSFFVTKSTFVVAWLILYICGFIEYVSGIFYLNIATFLSLFFVLSQKVAIFMTKLRLNMESIAHKIENRIKGFGMGKIFFADDFH